MSFETAHKFAMEQAKEFKAVWRSITNETYGPTKAETWRPESVPAFDPAELVALQDRLEATDAVLDAANQRMGMLNAEKKRHLEAAGKIGALKELAGRHGAISERIDRDSVEMESWAERVRELKNAHALKCAEFARGAMPCPDCGSLLVLNDGVLAHAPMPPGIGDYLARLAEYEKALGLMQKAVANGKRDLEQATNAKKMLDELTAISGTAPTEAEITAARTHLDDLKAERAGLLAEATKLAAAEQAGKRNAAQASKAKAAHQSVQNWTKIADALAPDGIPGEILAAALEPLNECLKDSGADTGWLVPSVGPDMQITAGYPMQPERPYALLSESEKWRVDAMLAEAVSRLSGLHILVLDRIDVLDLPGRSELVEWIEGLVEDKLVQSAILFGTLKAAPTGLPQSFESIWIDQGVVEQVKEAA